MVAPLSKNILLIVLLLLLFFFLESTALSRCFAKQGIKIPIRKEPRIGKNKQGSSAGLDSDSATTTMTSSVSHAGQVGHDNAGSDSEGNEEEEV